MSAFLSALASIRTLARRQADATLFDTPLHRWTFGEFDIVSNRLAHALAARGFHPGDRLACLSKHTAEIALCWAAAAKLGGVCMPVNWRLAPDEVNWILADGKARALMADAEFAATVKAVRSPDLAVVFGTHAGVNGPLTLGNLIATDREDDPGHEPSAQDTALQLYSSGTTGRPKGVELTFANLAANHAVLPATLDYDPAVHRMLNVLPAFHIAGIGVALMTAVHGAELVLHPEFDPPVVLDLLESRAITHTFLVPAMIQFLLEVPGIEQRDFSRLQRISYGASPISQRVLGDGMRVFGCGFTQVYGLTETTGAVTVLRPEEHVSAPDGTMPDPLRSAGRPMPGVQLRIVDPDSGAPLPQGAIGEIQIRSPQVMARYWRNPEATRAALFNEPDDPGAAGPWFRSGDAGFIHDGLLYLHDRIKDMIISGGENIYPAEVENVLMQSPLVADGAIIGIPDDRWGEAVKAVVVPRSGAERDEAALIAFMRERLAHFKCPSSVDWVDAIPRNSSGKILKRILREPYWRDHIG